MRRNRRRPSVPVVGALEKSLHEKFKTREERRCVQATFVDHLLGAARTLRAIGRQAACKTVDDSVLRRAEPPTHAEFRGGWSPHTAPGQRLQA